MLDQSSSKVGHFLVALILSTFFISTAPAHPPWGIVVNSTGIVYFSDLETVWRVDRDGKVSVFRPGVSGHHVHDLSIDDHDNIYGPELIYDSIRDKYLLGVWKMTPDGTQTQVQSPIESFMSGVGVCRDRAGNMYSIEQNNHTKVRTLLLRRTPNGVVSIVAGGAYGHIDGKGTAAKLGSVTAMTFGPDGDIYLTDGTGVRRATLDGDVNTITKDLTSRTSEDKPTLFGGNDKNIFGLAVDAGRNVYVADAGNRRLVKVANDGRVSVVYRLDPPYFPTGVFATASGDVYVLEFSFTPPGTTDQPRVRKISADGQNRIIGSTGRTGIGFIITPPRSQLPYGLQRLLDIINTPISYFVLLIGAGVISVAIILWRRSRKQSI